MWLALAIVAFVGCAQSSPPPPPASSPVPDVVRAKENPVPGDTAHQYWAEPMYDQVRVPAQLDPTGTYYRPSHQTLVEIRDGRYQKVQYPDSEKSEKGKPEGLKNKAQSGGDAAEPNAADDSVSEEVK